MKNLFIFLFIMTFSWAGFADNSSMCDIFPQENEISLIQAFAKLNRVLVITQDVDLTFSGCKNDTTWGLLEKNNYPSSFPDTEIVFMFFKGMSGQDGDLYEFGLYNSDDTHRDGLAWVSKNTGEVIFP